MGIHYADGDLFKGIKHVQSPLVIPHICNDEGRWGAGFSGALSRHFSEPEKVYRSRTPHLGDVQWITIGPSVRVVNMVAQHGTDDAHARGQPPIRYWALTTCMEKVAAEIRISEIHAPMFGSGLAGGDRNTIEACIQEVWCDEGILVTIYRWGQRVTNEA